MPKTLKIEDVDDVLVEKLSDRAIRHGRTIEAEHRAILAEALDLKSPFDDLAAQLRLMLSGRHHTPSEELLRESREER